MPFRSSLARSAGKLLGVFKEADLSLRGATQSSREIIVKITATGGDATTTPGDGYKYHYYTTTGAGPSFVVSLGNDNIEYVVVAGGGGGGSNGYPGSRYGCGGGAGGFRTNFPGVVDASPAPLTAGSSGLMPPGTYPVTVGAGGPGGTVPKWGMGTSGGDSTLTLSGSPIVSAGGGGGNGHEYPGTPNPTPDPTWHALPATDGGSSGGGSPTSPHLGNVPPVSPPQGNDGGSWTGGSWVGSGGGGAGAAGNPGSVSSGLGGNGVAVPQLPPSYGTPGPSPGRWFAGGGSGESSPTGSAGGGGAAPGNPGSANTGAGGGGTGGPTPAGNGGSGVIVIRYLV